MFQLDAQSHGWVGDSNMRYIKCYTDLLKSKAHNKYLTKVIYHKKNRININSQQDKKKQDEQVPEALIC